MNFWEQVTNNQMLNVVFLAWFIAQTAKVIIVLMTTKKIDFKRFISAGGMPSSHASTVVALTTCIAKAPSGYESVEFALAFVFSIIVMYDAAGVRRAAGKQAEILNKLVLEWQIHDDKYREVKLKELLGHTPVEVFVGAALGFAIAMMLY